MDSGTSRERGTERRRIDELVRVGEFSTAVPAARALVENVDANDPYALAWLRWLASVEALAGDFVAAATTLTGAIRAAGPGPTRERAMTMFEQGRVAEHAGNIANATAFFEAADAEAAASDPRHSEVTVRTRVPILQRLARMYDRAHDIRSALATRVRAAEMIEHFLEAHADAHDMRAHLLQLEDLIARSCVMLGDRDAITHLLRARDHVQALRTIAPGEAVDRDLLRVYLLLADAMLTFGDPLAIGVLEEARDLALLLAMEPGDRDLAIVYDRLSRAYERAGRVHDAGDATAEYVRITRERVQHDESADALLALAIGLRRLVAFEHIAGIHDSGTLDEARATAGRLLALERSPRALAVMAEALGSQSEAADRRGDDDERFAMLRAAEELLAEAAAADPSPDRRTQLAEARRLLSGVARDRGALDLAIDYGERAVTEHRAVLDAFGETRPRLTGSVESLRTLARARGDRDGFEARRSDLEAARVLARRLHETSGDNPETLNRVAFVIVELGDVSIAAGHADEAVAAFEEALPLARLALDTGDTTPNLERNFSLVLNKLGDAHRRLGHFALALAAYEESRTLREALLEQSGPTPLALQDLARVLQRLSLVRGYRNASSENDADEAIVVGERAVECARMLHATSRQRSASRVLASSLACLGSAHWWIGRPATGIGPMREALDVLDAARTGERSAPDDELRADVLRDLSRCLFDCADAQSALGAAHEAVALRRRGGLSRDVSSVRTRHALAEALAVYARAALAIEDGPAGRRAADESLTLARAVIDEDPAQPMHHFALIDALLLAAAHDCDAISETRAAIDTARERFGDVCRFSAQAERLSGR